MQSSAVAAGPARQPGRWNQLERYLVLGDDHGIYYAGERKLTADDAVAVRECLADDGARTVHEIAEVARSGRAPKHDPALFALALAASPKYADESTNAAALEALTGVVQTATHLKKFVTFVTAQRGWGRSLRSAIARWYLEKPPRELAHQMLKQRHRGRWSHADLLRLSHPKPANKTQSVLFRWAVEGELGRAPGDLLTGDLKQVHAFEAAKKASDKRDVIGLIEDYQLTLEMIPERWLSSPDIWEALLDSMPYCAMLRHLGKLTAVGLIAPQGEATALVAARLVDHRRIARAKASPVTLLAALLEYRSNNAVPAIAAALEKAYYTSLENVPPVGRRIGLGLDRAMLVPSTVMAMLAARTEPSARLDAVMTAIPPAGAPIEMQGDAEAVVVVTGGHQWTAGAGLAGVPLVVIAPNATEPPLGNLHNPTVLQVVGFDATVPGVVAAWIGSIADGGSGGTRAGQGVRPTMLKVQI